MNRIPEKAVKKTRNRRTKYVIDAIKHSNEPHLCGCGCGLRVAWSKWKNRWNKFLTGHCCRLPENRKIISERAKAGMNRKEVREFMSRAMLGNKNALGHRHSDEAIRKIKEKRASQVISKETGRKVSERLTGREFSIEHRRHLSEKQSAVWRNPVHRARLTKGSRERWLDPEFVAKYRKGCDTKPNKKEVYLFSILQDMFPGEWKYTGDFSFMINGKNPDFVNCNGQKKAVELFGDYWHFGEDPQNRIDAFTPFGYSTLVIWESELKDREKLECKLKSFNEEKHDSE